MLNIPNLVSISRIFFGIAVIGFFLKEKFALATALFYIGVFTDFLDGFIARKFNLKTNFGAILDVVADKTFIYTISLLFIRQIYPVIVLWVIRDIILVSLFLYKTKDFSFQSLLVGKIYTVLQFGLLFFLISFHGHLEFTTLFDLILLLFFSKMVFTQIIYFILLGFSFYLRRKFFGYKKEECICQRSFLKSLTYDLKSTLYFALCVLMFSFIAWLISLNINTINIKLIVFTLIAMLSLLIFSLFRPNFLSFWINNRVLKFFNYEKCFCQIISFKKLFFYLLVCLLILLFFYLLVCLLILFISTIFFEITKEIKDIKDIVFFYEIIGIILFFLTFLFLSIINFISYNKNFNDINKINSKQ